MEDWKECKLGDVCDFQEGYVNPPQSNPEYFDGDIKWLRATDLNDGYVYSTTRTLTQLGFRSAKKSAILFKPGTIAISKSGTIGRLGILQDYMCGNRAVINIIPHHIVNTFFLFCVLRSYQRHFPLMAVGSVQKNLYISILEDLKISLPDLNTQERIVSILKSLDDKIECNRRINENLEQQAQALFKSWFVDFEPFKDQPFVDSELGMIPQGWRVECLNEFGKIVCGKTPSKAESLYYGGNIPFVKIPDMHNNIFVLHSEDCLSDLGDKSQVGKRIPPYSVLVSCIATVGLVGMNVQTCHTNQQINTIIPNSIEYRYYLYQKLVTLKEYLVNLGRGGTATLNVNTRQFGNIRIVRPSDKVLCEYHQRVSCLFDKIEINSSESRRLAELRDTLLPKLMSGEINVNEVKI